MKAYELLDSPEKWCQWSDGLTAAGEKVGGRNPAAVKWCMRGAVECCYGDDSLLYKKFGRRHDTPVQFNDTPGRTWEEVHALLKELDI